ncbi:MAG: DUF6455 family protein [Paracoccaceae bacterium]
MSIFSKLDHHADLVHRMADTVGVDLAEGAMRGRIMEQELRSVVMRCMSCTEGEACEHWLEEHAKGADAAPDYCRNKSLLRTLAGA